MSRQLGAFVIAWNKVYWDTRAGHLIQRSISSFNDGRVNPAVMKEIPAVNDQVHFLMPGEL